jgi:hypothetical protein
MHSDAGTRYGPSRRGARFVVAKAMAGGRRLQNAARKHSLVLLALVAVGLLLYPVLAHLHRVDAPPGTLIPEMEQPSFLYAVGYNLAGAYLAACVFYFLTVLLPIRKERTKRIGILKRNLDAISRMTHRLLFRWEQVNRTYDASHPTRGWPVDGRLKTYLQAAFPDPEVPEPNRPSASYHNQLVEEAREYVLLVGSILDTMHVFSSGLDLDVVELVQLGREASSTPTEHFHDEKTYCKVLGAQTQAVVAIVANLNERLSSL